jgi:propionate CoA-transferase
MARSAAMAAKACGGKVIVQVKNYVNAGQIDAQRVSIAGIFVDAVVVAQDMERNHRQTPGTLYDSALAGHYKVPVDSIEPIKMSERKIIGRRAAMELAPNSIINPGIGVPEVVSAVVAEEGCSDELVMTVETGAIGGVPAGGNNFGASLNAWCMVDEPTQFDFYHSGGLDLAFLGFAEVNARGM